MSAPSEDRHAEADEQLHALIAEYHRRLDSDSSVDRDAFVAEHPDFSNQLKSYFSDVEQVESLAGPTASGLNAPDSPAAEQTVVSGETQDVNHAETMIENSHSADNSRLSQDAPPTQFGRYRILNELGRGAMGAVYLALDEQLDRKIALKIPQFGGGLSSDLLERFYREARAAGNLRHNGICPVYDVGEINGQHYITMAFIEGRPLRDFSKSSKRQQGKQVARVIRKIALAMEAAHKQNVVHRDLKPANVMIDTENEPVVMDFGLARRATENEEKITHTGTVIGTPAYMSPEQVDGDNDNVGPPADIYSLGVIFYELLTGELPFQGNLMSILKQISMKDPRPPSEVQSDVDPFLQDLCLKMLAKDAKDRPESMEQVAKELAEWLQGLRAPIDESGILETSRVPGQKKDKALALEATDAMPKPGVPRIEPQPEEFPAVEEFPVVVDTEMSATTVTPGRSTARAAQPPGKNRKLLTIGGLGGAVLLLAGITFFFTLGGKYDVKITVDDPAISLKVDGDDVLIDGVGSQIRLSAGIHTLKMEREGLEAELEEFTVKKDGKNAVHVAVVGGKFTIRNEKTPLVPDVDQSPSQSSEPPATNYALIFDPKKKSHVEIPGIKASASGPLTIECWAIPAREKQLASLVRLYNQPGCSLYQFNANWACSRFESEGQYTTGHAKVRADSRVHLAATWHDGSMTLFADGKKVGNQKQSHMDHVPDQIQRLYLGGQLNREQKSPSYLWAGTLDEVRISNIVRYDAEFTPAHDHQTDKHTLALYHFDEGQGDVLKDSSGNNHHGKIVGAKWVRVSGASLPAEVDLKRGLVGHWNFDEGAGTTARDSSGNNHHGVLKNMAASAWVTDVKALPKIEGNEAALQFDGIDDGVAIPKVVEGDQFSLSMWFRQNGRFGNLLALLQNDGWKPGDVHFQIRSTMQLGLGIYTPDPAEQWSDSSSEHKFRAEPTAEWQHAVVTLGGVEGEVRFYINGKLDRQIKLRSIATMPRIGPGLIGDWNSLDDGGTGLKRRAFNGLIDDVRIYNRALNKNEIAVLAGKPTGLDGKGSPWMSPLARKDGDKAGDNSSQNAASGRTIDLLPLVDVSLDAVKGEWKSDGNALTIQSTTHGVIEIPYQPPEEYDVTYEFTRRSGNRDVSLMLCRGGSAFGYNSGQTGIHYGFSDVDGKPAFTRHPDLPLKNGRRYTARVEVRRNRLRGFLDGRLVSEVETDGHKLSPYPDTRLRSDNLLGLTVFGSSATFHKVQVVEVTGTGKLTRGTLPRVEATTQTSHWLPLGIAASFHSDVISTESRKSADQFTFNGGTVASASWLRKRGLSEPGLPDDGRVAIPGTAPATFFQTQLPPEKNAMLVTSPDGVQPKPITVELTADERRAYTEIAILHCTCWGNGKVRVTLRYETGQEETMLIPAIDWSPKDRIDPLPENLRVAVTTRDTHPQFGSTVDMLAQTIAVDPQRPLRSLTFAFDSLKDGNKNARSRFTVGIFAISARVASENSVEATSPGSTGSASAHPPVVAPRRSALEFDGVDDFVDLPRFSEEESYTIEAICTPYRYAHSQVVSSRGFYLGMSSEKDIWQLTGRGGSNTNYVHITSPEPIRIGQQVTLAGVHDGKNLSLFIDGKPVGRQPAGRPGPAFRIGSQLARSGNHFSGTIEAVRISRGARYDRDYSIAEPWQSDESTIAVYHFDEGQGDVLKDSSGNDHHGRIVGAKWVQGNGVSASPPNAEPVVNSDKVRWPLKPSNPEDIAWLQEFGVIQTLRSGPQKESRLRPDNKPPAGAATIVGIMFPVHNAKFKPELTDGALKRLATLVDLESLAIRDIFQKTSATHAGLQQLTSLVHLRRLALLSCFPVDFDPEFFEAFQDLEYLTLANAKGLSWGQSVARLPSLRELVLHNSSLEDLESMGLPPKLSSLVLAGAPNVGRPERDAAAKEFAKRAPWCRIRVQDAPGENVVVIEPTAPLPGSSGAPPPPAVAPFGAATARQHQLTWADYLGEPVETTNSIGMKLTVIPPGEFKMGEGEAAVDVTLTKPFRFGLHEVTQGQWKTVMGTEPWKGREFVHEGENVAATHVSWTEATEFCHKLTDRERIAGTLPKDWEYSLPTEAEWEYACRAGTTTKYMFGDADSDLSKYAWYDSNAKNAGEAYAHEVASKKTNPWGLYDVHGNVSEWCPNYWHGDALQRGTDSKGPSERSDRVYRGGSWNISAGGCRSASRGKSAPSSRYEYVGFRVALSPSEDSSK